MIQCGQAPLWAYHTPQINSSFHHHLLSVPHGATKPSVGKADGSEGVLGTVGVKVLLRSW